MYMGTEARGRTRGKGWGGCGGGGAGGGTGQSQGCNSRNHWGANKQSGSTAFKGWIPELSGHIFDCTHITNVEKVDRSPEECVNYITTKLTSGRVEIKYTPICVAGRTGWEQSNPGEDAPLRIEVKNLPEKEASSRGALQVWFWCHLATMHGPDERKAQDCDRMGDSLAHPGPIVIDQEPQGAMLPLWGSLATHNDTCEGKGKISIIPPRDNGWYRVYGSVQHNLWCSGTARWLILRARLVVGEGQGKRNHCNHVNNCIEGGAKGRGKSRGKGMPLHQQLKWGEALRV